MRSKQNREEGRSQRGFRPRFESLESRRMLSASPLFNFHGPSTTPAPTASVNISGNTATVKDSNPGDTITVTDSGTGVVSVTITNGTTTVASGASQTGEVVTRVNINATGVGDIIDYNYNQTLTLAASTKPLIKSFFGGSAGGESISINASGGGDTLNLNFGNISSNLDLDVDVRGGGNNVTEAFSAITGGRLDSSFDGDHGSGTVDTFAATIGAVGTSTSPAKAFFDVYGSGGGDTLSVTGNGTVAADSLLDAVINGGGDYFFGGNSSSGGDTINFTFDGQLIGNLGVSTSGSGGNETIIQTITAEAGSIGNIYAVEFAGRSTTANNLTANVTDNSGMPSTLGSVNAYVFDHTGDKVTSTSNVKVITLPPSWFNGGFGF